MQSSTRSRRQPGNKAIGMRVIYSESEEAAASSASMLGTPMHERATDGGKKLGNTLIIGKYTFLSA